MRVNVVTTRDGRLAGLIKFIGHTSFSPGIWIGVSLDAPMGKNDGTVQGRRYFDCAPEHGLFVKEDVIEKVSYSSEGELRQSNGSLNGSVNGSLSGAHGHSGERDTVSTTSQESPSAASSFEGSEKKGSITGLLKLKLSQMMEMLNHQLEIVVQLEEEDRNRPASATHSKHATELHAEIVRVTNQEQNLINAFKQHLHDRLT